MSIYLLTPDPSNDQVKTIEEKLQKTVPDVRKISKVEDIADEIREFPERKIIVIYLAPSITADGITNLVDISGRYHQRVFFILVSNEISAINYKRLIHSGGADWVAANSELEEIPELIAKQTISYHKNNGNIETKAKPVVISFLPCSGGIGNTTIAIETALQIKREKTSRTRKLAYIDFDFQTSHVCDFLDIEPRLQIAEIFERPERLDDQLFELFISHHSSDIDVFAAPRSKLDPCEINVVGLDALLGMIQARYDLIILDLPVPWYRWTVPIIENSTAVILSGVNTIPCLHQIRATLDAVLTAKTSWTRVAIVINRVTTGLFGRVKRGKHIKSVLSGEVTFYVHEDSQAVHRLNTGTPAGLGGTRKQVKDFVGIAAFCTKLQSQVPQTVMR